MIFKSIYKKIKNILPTNKNILFEKYKIEGNLYLSAKKYNDAEACYKKMISALPGRTEGYINLAFMFIENDLLDDAEYYIRKAIKIDNKDPDSFYILGKIKHKKNHLAEAISNYKLAASFCKDPDLFLTLGEAFFILNKIDESTRCLYGARSLAPDDHSIEYLINSREGRIRPDTAPTGYIETLFDTYANSFDEILVKELDYIVPQKLVALLDQEVNLMAQQWSVLDLGCGTGLLGQAMASYAYNLVGVDLSPNMLKKAEARHIYNHLVNAELVSMMRNELENSYDVVMAADVFIYVGKLDETFSEVRRVLKPRGFFVFSLEALQERVEEDARKNNHEDFVLNATSRYSHSAQYIEKLAKLNHFVIRKMMSGELRKNAGMPVCGLYVLCELIK